MPVDTAKVASRRNLRLQSLDELLAEAERLASAECVSTSGNWSLGQIFQHLATAIELSIDGTDYKPSLFLRLIGPIFKRRMLNKGLKPGFRLPSALQEEMVPSQPVPVQEALTALHRAVQRLQTEPPQPKHFVFGTMTRQEWIQMHLRHAELHLSFATDKSRPD